LQQKQAAESTVAELRQSLQEEQKRTAALMQEVRAAQAMTTAAEQQHRAIEEAQARAAALTNELAGTRREIETQAAAKSQKAVDEALQQKQAAENTIADLQQSSQQERPRVDLLSSEVRQKLKALAKLPRQESGKDAYQAAENAKAELRPSRHQKRRANAIRRCRSYSLLDILISPPRCRPPRLAGRTF
jgi:hypothetical protein